MHNFQLDFYQAVSHHQQSNKTITVKADTGFAYYKTVSVLLCKPSLQERGLSAFPQRKQEREDISTTSQY